ncbi:glycosyl hydrolase 115 family protein [Sphingomonas cannabina]|uniref:glycosyl hydrolase 115 family protein n=1 Tax=Sphingomonas cannabina TaxID=2899123 RepID=UPI001F36D2EE|nr:glycosyl hydrolase 115 family protein [Sphingomonas cannabina]UIJ47199.1 glycosyl hydrolase 115 family protein [Sphingomonas cannabina]
MLNDLRLAKGQVVIIGAIGTSPVIDRLAAEGKLATSDLRGRWEAYRQVVVERPLPNIPRALVIVGSDRRGAVFGAYDLSAKIGVNPWNWWADIPVRKRDDLFLTAGSHTDQPKVRYRGFFINDEDPAFSGWAKKTFGGLNSAMYEHVFELVLRMKGNYLWPAMWGKAFAVDDPRNQALADQMGVVMGTSHHEPMMRAQAEWHRDTGSGVTGGKWDYAQNGANLRAFWRGAIERMASKPGGGTYESLVTIGMRGDGDEPMAEGTATRLLETIVADQRRIIADVTGKPAERTPQVWALYKEVQDYYDDGMTVPDDVILLFCDDNWGQIRRLPEKPDRRAGGYGVYYHFDYVGAPRNYKWINTNQIEKTWQQMDLAYRRGARSLWIVNVGDIKPMEFPLQFFMDMAWDPEAMTPAALAAYPERWAAAAFGPDHAQAIGRMVTRYGQLAARRKPELIDAASFDLGPASGKTLDGGEFGAMVAEWDALEREMLAVKASLPPEQRDAYFQLVEHPIAALGNLYRLYYAVAWNRRLAAAGDVRANAFADLAEAAYRRDGQLTHDYHALAGGKWDRMMSQIHIGYTNWQQPDTQKMPEVVRVPGGAPVQVPTIGRSEAGADPGIVAIEAPGFSRTVNGKGLTWTVIPHLGRTLGSVVALPQGRPATGFGDGVRLEYDVDLRQAGDGQVLLYLVPTLDTHGGKGLRIGVSVDDGPPQTLTFNPVPAAGGARSTEERAWVEAVKDNAVTVSARFPALSAGRHRVRVWRLDDNVVLQKLVIATRPVPPSYLGPVPTAASVRK